MYATLKFISEPYTHNVVLMYTGCTI